MIPTPYLLKGGLVADPRQESTLQLDLLVAAGRVAGLAADLKAPEA